MKTVKEVREFLAKLPDDQAVAVPIFWTLEDTNAIFEDNLKAPLTNEQWSQAIDGYFKALNEFFWEESEEAMSQVLTDAGLMSEED